MAKDVADVYLSVLLVFFEHHAAILRAMFPKWHSLAGMLAPRWSSEGPGWRPEILPQHLGLCFQADVVKDVADV